MFRTLVISAAIFLVACSTTNTAVPSDNNADLENVPTTDKTFGPKLAELVVLRWNNLIGGKFDDAYEMLSPGYRQTHEKKEYGEILRNRPVRWTKATYVDHNCSSDELCTVRVNIAFQVTLPGVGTVPSENIVEEKWLRVGGGWYFFPENAAK